LFLQPFPQYHKLAACPDPVTEVASLASWRIYFAETIQPRWKRIDHIHTEKSVPAILLVEDDELIRAAISFVLKHAGYEVVEARDGQEGTELFSSQPEEISLVLSDLMMPHLDGLEMLQILRSVRPQVKYILFTGVRIDEQTLSDHGIDDWLAKPFAMEQLLGKVVEALAA
jgi:CheY-like chemotaxis protein